MYYTFCKGNPNTPQKHDKQDYREIGGGVDPQPSRHLQAQNSLNQVLL